MAMAIENLMFEVTLSGKDHCRVECIGCLAHLAVTERAAGLDDGCNTPAQSHVDAITTRKEGIGSHCSTL